MWHDQYIQKQTKSDLKFLYNFTLNLKKCELELRNALFSITYYVTPVKLLNTRTFYNELPRREQKVKRDISMPRQNPHIIPYKKC